MTSHICPHDHSAALPRPPETFLEAADRLCNARNVKLTPIRRLVLEIVAHSAAPCGAYTILDLVTLREGKKTAPLTIYRALDFLAEQGLIHKIESKNSYIACLHPQHRHGGLFLVCDCCGVATEIQDKALSESLQNCAGNAGFQTDHWSVEIKGHCKSCTDKA
jgi:Fur family transcriptional regulator, zinc uptake regulator